MRSSFLRLSSISALCLVIFNMNTIEATFGITLGTLALSAAQVTTIAAVAVLAKKGILVGSILGKREVDEQEITLEKLTLLEPDDCYKRIFCAASTGK